MITVPHPAINVNGSITFKLMKRLRGSLIAHPIDQQLSHEAEFLKMADATISNVYSKLLLADKDEVCFAYAKLGKSTKLVSGTCAVAFL